MPSFLDQLMREARIHNKSRRTLLGLDAPSASGLALKHTSGTPGGQPVEIEPPPAPAAPIQPSAPVQPEPVAPAPATPTPARTAVESFNATRMDMSRDFYRRFGRYPTATDIKLLMARQKLRKWGIRVTPERLLGEVLREEEDFQVFTEDEYLT